MGTLVLYRDTLDICRRHYGHVWMPQRVRTICQSWGLLCVGHDMLQLWFCTVNMIHQSWWSLSISRQFFFQWNLWTLKKSYPTKHCPELNTACNLCICSSMTAHPNWFRSHGLLLFLTWPTCQVDPMANPRFWVCLPKSIHQRPARPAVWCTSLLDAWESDVTVNQCQERWELFKRGAWAIELQLFKSHF